MTVTDHDLDLIRAGKVDPYVERPDRLDASHARRTAGILRDERDTLDVDDPRHDVLAERAAAWDERAAALELARHNRDTGRGIPAVDVAVTRVRRDGLAGFTTGADVYLATEARAELDVLTTPELAAKWVTRRPGGTGNSVYVYTLTYRLAGHEWTGEAAIAPGLDPATIDDVSLRRVQQGAAKVLREALVPTGAALEAAIQTGRPR